MREIVSKMYFNIRFIINLDFNVVQRFVYEK